MGLKDYDNYNILALSVSSGALYSHWPPHPELLSILNCSMFKVKKEF